MSVITTTPAFLVKPASISLSYKASKIGHHLSQWAVMSPIAMENISKVAMGTGFVEKNRGKLRKAEHRWNTIAQILTSTNGCSQLSFSSVDINTFLKLLFSLPEACNDYLSNSAGPGRL